jgi:cell division protein FtsQ
MARRGALDRLPPESLFSGIRWGRFILWLVLGVFTMAGTLLAWRRTEDFLIKDDRFRLTEADELNGQSPNLIVEGIQYASPSEIRHVFAPDVGRSLYLVPIQERRQQLLAIDWVEEAAISKIWPDTLMVHVTERTPVAFVRLPADRNDGMSQFALIDKDGYILRPRVAARFTLPVITGVRETEPLEDRRARVHRVLSMLNAIGPMSQQISEIDAADPNNLIVAEHVDNRVVNLMLGDENYKSRLSHFLANYAEIQTKPGGKDATTFDLRIDEDITAVGVNQ